MVKKIEKEYNIPEEVEKEDKDLSPKIEIPEQELKTLEIIAKRVGGDFGMEVRLGEPGKGSFFNPEDVSITFDPLHIKENPKQARFVAAHEGAHRAITKYGSPTEIGISQEKARELYSQIGFGYLQNVIEDPAVNDWLKERFPGLKEYIRETYDEQLKEENAVLSTPEVTNIALQLGYWPKFTHFGSEIIRNWHQKRFSKQLDPAVKKALERTIKYAEESIKTIPDPNRPGLDRREITETARRRFEINTNYIWPEMKKLVEMDLKTERNRQMLKDLINKKKTLEQKQEEMEKAKKQGDQKKAEELEKEVEKLKQDLKDFDEISEQAKRELEREIERAIKEGVERLNKEIDKKQKEIEEARQKQEGLEKEIKDLEEKAKKSSGKEKEDLEKEIENKKAEKLLQEMKQKQAEKELEDIQDVLDNIQSGREIPYPEDKLSDETKQELDKLFKKLPKQKQEELKERAQKTLEDFEDEINKDLEGKLNKDNPESHKKIREREKQEKEISERREKEEQERKKLEKKLEELRREKMTEYDKAYEEVADIINRLYPRLKNFFLPERHPKWRKGYPTGSRLDLQKAMQAEADPRYLEKIWERKTIPHKYDYRFSLLVDTSDSMEGEKIEETFKGLVVLAEVLERLGIQYEIIGFSSGCKVFKEWQEKLNKQKRDELAELKTWGREYTHTDEATELARERLLKNRGKYNFILTLTDGVPYPKDPHESRLKTILKKLKEEGIKVVGVGLGPNTEFVRNFYKAAISLPDVKVNEEERRQGKKDFAEAFADLLEDMIRHPEKY